MEIEVTHLWRLGRRCYRYSDSIAHSGRTDIGEITWANALKAAKRRPLCSKANQPALREWLAGFGAWERKEIRAMSDTDTNALLLQFVAGDVTTLREHPGELDQTGLLFGDDGKVYFYAEV